VSSLDRWILARLNQVVGRVTERLEEYDPYGAALAVEPLLDDLTNWYIRRSRRRFWKSEHDADKDAAYATLYDVLVTLSKLLAPFVPFVSEVMYQNLVRQNQVPTKDEGACESVHHCEWPAVDRAAIDQDLLDRMSLAMQIATLGRSARSTSGVKLRQPLARARVRAGAGSVSLGDLADLVTDELNVKALEFVDEETDLVEYEIGLLPNVLGPKYGRRFPLLRQAIAAANDSALAGTFATRFEAGLSVTLELSDGDPAVELLPEEVEVRTRGREGYAVAEEKGVLVAVDVTLTPELAREGQARDLVRRIQTLRKEADFQLDDRIVTFYDVDEELSAVVEEWAGYIQAETLSRELVAGPVPDDVVKREQFKLKGQPLTLGVRKA
jgi:isoleucyl-tRNA synthetase